VKEFTYKITDTMGLHARPAGEFVKEASTYESNITISKGEKVVDAKKIFSVMGLVVKCGDEVKITLEGTDEDLASVTLQKFMQEHL
jgi:Phosphotransferase System HPr (HPr) Family